MLRVDYRPAPRAGAGVLGVLVFGGASIAPSPQLVHVALEPAAQAPVFEIWHVEDAVVPLRIGPVSGAVSGQYCFGSVEITDEDGRLLDERVARAYGDLFHFMQKAGDFQPIRFWNYISDIVGDQQGMERYWRFNLGRQRAFADLLRQARPPVATGIGCGGRRTVIYVLGARNPAEPVENPRQVSAYAYPERYGPASPGFSRASRHEGGTLFISGTASIVGHETRHPGDIDAQIRETLKNLDVMMRLTAEGGAREGRWAVKTYLRDIAHAAKLEQALAALFPPGTRYLHLTADICRRDLLVEIEATRGA